MGISNKSHGKKSDKETQSPVLKLFKDMMHKEKHDPEKTNLLKSKAEKNKKKHSGSRSKSDHKTVESSCSEHRNPPYRGNQELLNAEFTPTRTHSIPFQGEKRESWWFWGESSPAKPPSDETCSCVSCALKKIISTDYACIGCLVLLFTISVVVAFLLVYKSIPCFSDKTGYKKVDTDRPKRKIDGLNRMRWDHLGKKTSERNKWDTGESTYGVPRSMDFQDLNNLVDADSDLFKIMDSDLMSEIQNSDRLREFYKKLIKTDAQIRNLKKNSQTSVNNIDDIEDKYQTYPERAKRSLANLHKPRNLFHFKKHKKGKANITNDKNKIVTGKNKDGGNISKVETKAPIAVKDSKQKNLKASRNKRFDNISQPEGFLIEKKKVLIQYKPKDNTNRKSKCSHAPNESKSHENQLKHPFYQNTQRLDELLDKFFDKNLPEILGDQFEWDMIFEKDKNECKHPSTQVETPLAKETTPKRIINKTPLAKNKDESNTDEKIFSLDDDFTNTYRKEISTVQNDIFSDLEFGDEGRKKEEATTNDYRLLMSVSTMMYAGNTNIKRTTYKPNFLMDRAPNARKLLQTDADDDMNEVVVKTHDIIANQENRKKRMDELTLEGTENKLKINPVSILSPSWKGPMPLYPDELNSIIKQEPILVNKVATPVQSKYNFKTNDDPIAVNKAESPEHSMALEEDGNLVRVETPKSKDSPLEEDEFEADLNDMEYIEDYFRNKYDRLVGLAQAYSDYGVLDGKKILTEKKVDDKIKLAGPDHIIKLSLSGLKDGFKSSIFGRPKKGNENTSSPSEGFRLKWQPSSSSREDNPQHLLKVLQKHIKVADFKPIQTTSSELPEIDLVYTLRDDSLKTTKKIKQDSHDLVFSIGKGKRSLKSVETENYSESIPNENQEDDVIYFDQNIRNVFDIINIKHKREVDNNSILADISNLTSNAKMGIADKFASNSTMKIDAKDEATNNTEKLATGDALSNIDMNFSDFFMLLSSWFSALDGVDININHNVTGNTSSSSPNNTNTKLVNETVEIAYPAYDSDMIENIGHRSRVLLAVEDYNDTVNIEHKDGKDRGITKANDHIDVKTNITASKPKAIINLKVNKTKSIVKRDADSNLIFWNDLYDDEYGVAVDHLENNIRDKHSIAKNDFMKRPNEWFRNKVRKIADGFHKKAESLRKGSNTDALKSGKETNKEAAIKSKSKQAIYKRISRKTTENDPSLTKKTDFAALTANMKIICRKAAKDIEQANKVNVREVSKDGQATSSLMQQLVRLMGDLVDYQVKQRTCRKLPPDLQTFLEWLTSTSSETEQDKYSSNVDEYPNIDFGKVIDKSEDHSLGMSSSERDTPDPRSDCLGTLQAVQALMQQYEDLGEDDKSKMSGVKEYLASQLQYLQKQMPSIQDFNLYNTDGIRFRRDASTQTTPKAHRSNKKRKRKLKQAFKSFIKKSGRKHYSKDQTTLSNAIKKVNKDSAVEESKNTSPNVNAEKDKVGDLKTVKEKRNLRDVYYKALADAKKLTTIKNHD